MLGKSYHEPRHLESKYTSKILEVGMTCKNRFNPLKEPEIVILARMRKIVVMFFTLILFSGTEIGY